MWIVHGLAVASDDNDAKNLCRNSRVDDLSDWDIPTQTQLESMFMQSDNPISFTGPMVWVQDPALGRVYSYDKDFKKDGGNGVGVVLCSRINQ